MFPVGVLAIVVIALIVIGVLVYWILAGISAANDAAGYLARPFDSSIGSSGGLIGGEKALGEIVPLGALALLVGLGREVPSPDKVFLATIGSQSTSPAPIGGSLAKNSSTPGSHLAILRHLLNRDLIN